MEYQELKKRNKRLANNPEPGIYYDVPFEEYLKWEAFSKSGISHIMKSPKHYRLYRDEDRKQTSSMKLGSLTDCLLLEPEKFDSMFITTPATYEKVVKETKKHGKEIAIKDWDWRSKFCQQWRADKEQLCLTVVTPKEVDEAMEMVNAIKNTKTGSRLIQGKPQVSLFWIDDELQVPCKARLDIDHDECIPDLKTTKNGRPDVEIVFDDPEDCEQANQDTRGFRKEMFTYGYHQQGAFYTDGYEILSGIRKAFVIIAVENFAPYHTSFHCIREDSLFTGRVDYKKALRIYRNCLIHDKWPGYPDCIVDEDIPPYALKSIEHDEEY